MILTKREAVEKYGSEGCKEHFEKYGKFRKQGIEDALIKTLEQHYEVVEKTKQGRSIVYKLEGKREKVAVREDNRITNGSWSNPYTKNMDIMVVSVLEQELITSVAQSLNSWCLEFGLITEKMYSLLLAKHNEYYKQLCLEELKDNNIISDGEERILNDFIYGFKELKGQLVGTLNRMAKANIIEYYPVFKGSVKKTGEIINLSEVTVNKIFKLRTELMEELDVTDWYLNQFKNAPKTKEFNSRWKDELAQITDDNGDVLDLDYFYKQYAIILKARKKRIISYLEKYNKKAIEQFKQDEKMFIDGNISEYHEKRNEHVVNESIKKEDSFLGKKTKKIGESKELGLGEQEKVYFHERGDFTFDEGYYDLYFSRLYSKRIKELQEYYGHTFN